MGALVALVACAKIAGLESVEGPSANDAGSLPTTAEGISISPAKLEIETACGVTSDDRYISIDNTGGKEIPYEVKVAGGSVISALRDDKGTTGAVISGVVAPGKLVQVFAVVTSSTPGTMSGELFITTGGHTQRLPTQVTIKGGSLVLNPPLVDFGEVRENTSTPPQTVELENVGNAPVTVQSWSSGAPNFTMSTGSITIAPGQKGTASATFVPGAAGPQVSAELQPSTLVPLCTEAPKLTLKGTHVNQNVTVNPGSIDFGNVDCNATSGDVRDVVVSNYAGTPASANVTLPATSWFRVVTPMPMGVPAGGTATITFGLKQLPSTLEDHTEAISVDVGFSGFDPTTKTVNARVNTVGAIVTIAPATLSGFASGETKQFTLKNDGNKFIYVHLNNSNAAAFDAPTEAALYPGFGAIADVKFIAASPGTYNAEITTTRADTPLFSIYPTSRTLCNAPTVVSVTASR